MRRRRRLLLLVTLAGPLVSGREPAIEASCAAAWPIPAACSCHSAGGRGRPISRDLRIAYASAGSTPSVVAAAIARYTPLLRPESSGDGQTPAAITDVRVFVEEPANDWLGKNTSYAHSLELGADNSTVRIEAQSVFGVAYALETLSQLTTANTLNCSSFRVSDAPEFQHRGLMVDSGRRFYPPALLRSLMDGMAYSKMNVLHLHATDFGGFRFQSQRWPQLTAGLHDKNGGRLFYTKQDIQSLVTYGRERGIRLIGEVDIPAHACGFWPLATVGLRFCTNDTQNGTQIPMQLANDPAGRAIHIIGSLLD